MGEIYSFSSESSDSEDETDMRRQPTVTFQLTQGPISGGQSLLQDSRGYTYSIKVSLYLFNRSEQCIIRLECS